MRKTTKKSADRAVNPPEHQHSGGGFLDLSEPTPEVAPQASAQPTTAAPATVQAPSPSVSLGAKRKIIRGPK